MAPNAPAANDPNTSPIAFFFRQYADRIAPAVQANLARGMSGSNVIGAIADATPPLKNRTPWKQGIRSYYPYARKLRGLNVRDNWLFRVERYEDKGGSSGQQFVVGALYNPHPGGQMLFHGNEMANWVMSPQYPNPELLRGSVLQKRAQARAGKGSVPEVMRFSEGGKVFFTPNLLRRKPVAPDEVFRQKVLAIMQSRNRESAQTAMQEAMDGLKKVAGFGAKNQMFLRWFYTAKQLSSLTVENGDQ